MSGPSHELLLASALAKCANERDFGPEGSTRLIALLATEARALLAEIERLRHMNRNQMETILDLRALDSEEALKFLDDLHARPTREQALRAICCGAGHAEGPHTHKTHEDCLDAAMREGEA